MIVVTKIFLPVSGMFFMIFFIIVKSLDLIKIVQNYKMYCELTDTEEMLYGYCYDKKLAVDKVVVNAQWHVQAIPRMVQPVCQRLHGRSMYSKQNKKTRY
jgi:hypothetical protein